MYLVVRESDRKIVLSSVRPLDETQYTSRGMIVVEIPDDEYTPNMVGGHLKWPTE